MSEKITKADVIRRGLAEHPDLKPKELSELLNKKLPAGVNKIKAVEISGYKTKTKVKEPTPRVDEEPNPPHRSNGNAAELIKALEVLVASHGADKIKSAVNFLETF